MKTTRTTVFCALIAILCCPAVLVLAGDPSDLVVHEWGTFLAMQGSDGVVLDGMYHEEHALPGFVHARSRDQLHLPSARMKGETPIIYFYTETERDVWVQVEFPTGIWTQWYPQAASVGPALTTTGTPPRLQGGFISWSGKLIPAVKGKPPPSLPETRSDSLWNFARQVDAAYVKTTNHALEAGPEEYERFIFYRGLGTSDLPVELSPGDGGTLGFREGHSLDVRHVFALRVEKGKGAFRYFPELPRGTTIREVLPPEGSGEPLEEFTEKVAADLAARLVDSGLYPKEARAMVNTWRQSYFLSEGVRILFVLPQAWTDEFIPLRVYPPPREIVRVMVGRLEVLTPERERAAELAVQKLASPDPEKRELAFTRLRQEGRYVEPIIRRVLNVTASEKVRTLCRRLLLSSLVTEIRSAVNAPTTGKIIRENPDLVRTHLASLLREVGLDSEARAVAKAALPALKKMEVRPFEDHRARHFLRANARVLEGLGDDRGAAQAYQKFIRFGAQLKADKNCLRCHDGMIAPKEMAWFRDFWAGEKFARYEALGSSLEKAIGRHRRALESSPDDTGRQMMLGYLYKAKGDQEQAMNMWALVEGKAELAAAQKED